MGCKVCKEKIKCQNCGHFFPEGSKILEHSYNCDNKLKSEKQKIEGEIKIFSRRIDGEDMADEDLRAQLNVELEGNLKNNIYKTTRYVETIEDDRYARKNRPSFILVHRRTPTLRVFFRPVKKEILVYSEYL